MWRVCSGTCLNVTPEGSALSTGGALRDGLTVKVFLWISHPVCDLLFVHPSFQVTKLLEMSCSSCMYDLNVGK